MKLPLENIQAVAQQYEAAMIDFAQHMIRTPSLPGQENEVAAIIINEMNELAYDEVWTDQVGNVIGKIKGGDGPVILLNGHMDHVDPGPVEGWPYPPFSGQIVGDELWGRASVDMKGPVACMIYAASLLKRLHLTPPGDILMTVPVMEEVCGLGTQHLAAQHKAQAAICGEPSNNGLRRGHRGRVELQLQFTGRSAHASVPHLGLNPHYLAASFLTKLPQVALAHDETLGSSTLVPTLYTTDQSSPNVIPSQVYLTLDWRNVPSETPAEIVAKVQAILDSCLEAEPKLQATLTIPSTQLTTYTGVSQLLPSVFPSFILPEDHRLIQAAHTTLNEVLGREVEVDVWRFATDGGHLMAAGIPTIGFGPGDDKLAHTNQEQISLTQMKEAVVAYTALILALAEAASE
jgi:succinyl-diaminopimelate desuccinylase